MSAYVAPLPGVAPLPEHLCVRVVVTRTDGRPLTAEDIAAAAAVYPPAEADRAAVAQSVALAASRAQGRAAKGRKRAA